MSNTQDLYKKAKQIIPGGVQLLSKSPEQFAPDQWPAYAKKSIGCEIWDMDDNHYYDMTTNGIGACLLGYSDPDVNQAVIGRIQDGSMSSLNSPEEVMLAERLVDIHPWAKKVRFARTGGEICAIAVRIARATTGRDIVAICGYHGWSDWYLACNVGGKDSLNGIHLAGLKPIGVPAGLKGTAVTFHHGNYEEFGKIISEYGDRLACVIMEPIRHQFPEPGFLEHVRDEIHRVGGLLIFDEITIGWRLTFGGSHKLLGVNPDMATFGKALGNGHPIAAVIGTEEAMDGANDSFISSTYWTEGVGPAAALATLKKMEETKVWEHSAHIGGMIHKNWAELALKYNLPIETGTGIPCLAEFKWTECPLEMKTLYTKLMLDEGFLGNNAVYPTLAHNEEIVDKYKAATEKVFSKMSEIYKASGREGVKAAIGGPVCNSGFKRLLD